MARAPAARLLIRVYRTLHRARRAGIAPREYAARTAEALSRRRFLGLTAAAPIVAACRPPPARAMPPSPDDVVIVGAGIAGLHCAYRLQKLGIGARLYDAAPSVGGRIRTDRHTFPAGMHCELGGELIDTNHTTMHALARELGIDLLDYDEDDRSLARLAVFIGGTRLSEDDILTGFAPIARAIDDARRTMGDPLLGVSYTNPNGAAALDAVSIDAWLTAIHASGPMRRLLEIAYTTEYGIAIDESSALNLILLIGTDVSRGFALYGPSDERFHARTGNATFIERLAAAIDPSRFTLDARLVRIARASDGRYALTFATAHTTTEVKTARVVLALPFSILRDVDLRVPFPAVKMRAIRELAYGMNTKLMAGFASRPWRAHRSNGETFTDRPSQSTWETSRLQPGQEGILTNYTGGAHAIDVGRGPPEAQLALFVDDVEAMFPGSRQATSGKVVRAFWPGNPLTKGSYSGYKVGQATAFGGAAGERFENVYFCGEHTSRVAQGYMEGGASSGAIVAEEIARDLGAGPIGHSSIRISR
jgi:monoamine oxidase